MALVHGNYANNSMVLMVAANSRLLANTEVSKYGLSHDIDIWEASSTMLEINAKKRASGLGSPIRPSRNSAGFFLATVLYLCIPGLSFLRLWFAVRSPMAASPGF